MEYGVVFSLLVQDESEYAQMRRWNMLINRNIERDGIVLWTSRPAVQGAFNQQLVKSGLIEAEYSRIYRQAREWREEQDYLDITRPLDEATATQIVQDAERFITRLERYLREVGAME